jgi:hypothetical protein
MRAIRFIGFAILLFIYGGCTDTMSGEKIKTIIWWTEDSLHCVRSLLSTGSGPPTMSGSLYFYDIVNGSGEDGRWAFIASHVPAQLSDEVRDAYAKFKPDKSENGDVHIAVPSFEKSIELNESVVSRDNAIYEGCLSGSLGLFGKKINELLDLEKKDHHIFMYRLRFDSDKKLSIDVGPFIAGRSNFSSSGLGFVFGLQAGIQEVGGGKKIIWSPQILQDLERENPSIEQFGGLLLLQDVKAESEASFEYASVPLTVELRDGAPGCGMENRKIIVHRTPGTKIRLVVKLFIEYRDCKRSGLLIPLFDELVKAGRSGDGTAKSGKTKYPVICVQLSTVPF